MNWRRIGQNKSLPFCLILITFNLFLFNPSKISLDLIPFKHPKSILKGNWIVLIISFEFGGILKSYELNFFFSFSKTKFFIWGVIIFCIACLPALIGNDINPCGSLSYL